MCGSLSCILYNQPPKTGTHPSKWYPIQPEEKPSPLQLAQDDIRSLLAHDIRRQEREGAGDLGVHRGVDDAQGLDAADPETGVEYGHWVAVGADGARARAVVAPGRVLDVLVDGIGALHGGAGKGLGEGDGLVTEGPAGDVDRLGDGVKIGGVVA